MRANSAYCPKPGDVNGNHGQGATTRASTAPLSTSFLKRVSTKMPCWGRLSLGYSVVNVTIRTGADSMS